MTSHKALTDAADAHYESTRDLLRDFSHGAAPVLPAPVVYTLVGNLKSSVGYTSSELLRHISRALLRSLDAYDVTDSGGDPSANAVAAAERIDRAAELAQQIGELLDQAQSAIAGQGYNVAP